MNSPILSLPYDVKAKFQERPNRFLGLVEIIDNKTGKSIIEKVHIHDPGRLQELLFLGNQVLLKRVENPIRKTRWDMLAACINNQWVLVHSGYHRNIVENILKHPKINPFDKLKEITPEVPMGNSRLDFLLTKNNGKKIYLEVKGCTLAHNGTALFPDAPTTRGTRHLKTLMAAKSSGASAAILILIFRSDSKCFAPNHDTDPKFAETFKTAINHGISVHPLVLSYNGKHIFYEKTIPVCPNL